MSKTPFTEQYLNSLGLQDRGDGTFVKAQKVQVAEPPKKSKYGNKKVQTKDGTFDSQKEHNRWLELKNNHTRYLNLERQKKFLIAVNGKKICSYICDFYYYDLDNSQWVVEDIKSEFTRKLPVYRLKKRLMDAVLNLQIVEK